MASLKRYFPIPFILIGLGVSAYGVSVLVSAPEPRWAWVGAIVAILPFVLFLLSLALFKRARTGRNQYPLLGLAVVGTVVSFAFYESPASWLALGLGLIPSFAYVYWYSTLDRSRSGGLLVGAVLPELELVDADGQAVTRTPGKHALYMFVRGK